MTEVAQRRVELAMLLAVGLTPSYLNGFYNWRLAANRSMFWSVEIFTWIVMPVVLILLGWRRGLYEPSELGLSSRIRGVSRPWPLLLLLIIVPSVLVPSFQAISAWAHRSLPVAWPVPDFQYFQVVPPPGPDTGWYRILAICHLAITAGIVEELYHRSLMDLLFPRGRLGGLLYIVISSLIFAGAHWEGGLPSVVDTFAFGVFTATVFRLTGNVWPLIVGHVITDWTWLNGH